MQQVNMVLTEVLSIAWVKHFSSFFKVVCWTKILPDMPPRELAGMGWGGGHYLFFFDPKFCLMMTWPYNVKNLAWLKDAPPKNPECSARYPIPQWGYLITKQQPNNLLYPHSNPWKFWSNLVQAWPDGKNHKLTYMKMHTGMLLGIECT